MSDLETKQDVLARLSQLLAEGVVTKEEILSLAGEEKKSQEPASRINLQRILYYLGGFVVLIGIAIIIGQFWQQMDQVTKTLISLGSAVSAYSLGYYFLRSQKAELGNVFMTISVALFPLGIGTSLDFLGISGTGPGGASIISATIFLIFWTSYISTKAEIFLPFAIAAASALYYSLAYFLLDKRTLSPDFPLYQTLTLGLGYTFLGFYYLKKPLISQLLYFFGLLAVLGTGIALQKFAPKQNLIWEFIYPFLLAGTFAASIKLQSKIFLIMATVFTFGEILKLTSEYFSKSLGWPISLILSGIFIIGVGYFSFEMNKKVKKTYL